MRTFQSALRSLLLLGAGVLSACGSDAPPSQASEAPNPAVGVEGPPQSAPPQEVDPRLAGGIGEYVSGPDTLSILEDGGVFYLLPWGGEREPLEGVEGKLSTSSVEGKVVKTLTVRGREFEWARLGGDGGGSFKIDPVRPPAELREAALMATPPEEVGDFLPSDLVELVTLDPTILLDVRYASTNNFLGEVFYSSPRAFLQRPAAEALTRASAWLQERGYGLLVHDGYRPWYVTKMFWDATPEELKVFVADPANGSRHNRGCAVDLTLYDLDSGEPVVMPGGFDEMSPRSYVDYAGGTSRQRWFRELLRAAMEAQGFEVYPAEWWHFDHQDWRSYRIQNLTFEEIGEG